jgi:hypothetical protein
MNATLKRREMATAHVHLTSRAASAEPLMIAKHARDASREQREQREPVDRRLRNLIIAGNAIVWIGIITALILFLR